MVLDYQESLMQSGFVLTIPTRRRPVLWHVFRRDEPSVELLRFLRLPHKLNLDSKDLESRFYALSKQWHPDRFARGSADQRRISEDATATLNDGYRTLRSQSRRIPAEGAWFHSAEQKRAISLRSCWRKS
jgi:hypothetical protein